MRFFQNSDRALWLQRAITIAFVCGLLLSAPLWFGLRTYPIAPLVVGVPALLVPLDALFFVLAVALLGVLCVSRQSWWVTVGLLGTLGVFIVTDITRLQPWVYQYAAMLGAFAFCTREKSLNVCRFIVAATYVWSGVQKLNPQFMQSTFAWLLAPLGTFSMPHLAIAVALAETLLGLGLLWGKTRHLSVVLVVVMHLLILLSIGPLGHNWNTIVWPWNIAMMMFVVLLFWKWNSGIQNSEFRIQNWLFNLRSCWYSIAIVLLFGVMPLFSFFGLWDSYLSASLYSGNTDSARIAILDRESVRLPPSLQKRFESPETPLLFWSMDELNVPPYPEARVFRSIFHVLCTYSDNPDALLLYVKRKWLWTGPQENLLETCPTLGVRFSVLGSTNGE